MEQAMIRTTIRKVRWATTSLTLAGVLVVASGCGEPLGPGDGFPRVADSAAGLPAGALRLAYEEDAVRLAVRHLIDTGAPQRHDVIPPAALVASLYNALVHVHAFAHPARDTVVDVYRIHSFPHPQTRQLMVRVDPAHAWTNAWRVRNAYTGNPAVDTLVSEFELSVHQFHQWSIGDVAVLRSARPLHAAALAARFESIAGVVWAEQDGAIGDGNDIRAQRLGHGWRLDFSVGYGDCPAGCINRRTWSFSVSATGAVGYLGASGAAPPPRP
jgi:hypothetical protein